MSEYELGVIGGGNMAEAIIGGLTASGFVESRRIIVSDVSAERRAALSRAHNVVCTDDNLVPASAPKVLLAVKPQVMPAVLAQIAPAVRADALLVSIAAGVKTARIDQALGGRGRIVRVMPNTPMLVGAGMAAIAPGPRAGQDDVAWVRRLFLTAGAEVVVDEAMMDAVTALSGSGPAYFFYLIEAMVEAGTAEGLTKEVALELARQTCLGAGKLLVQTGQAPEELRKKVTSPGGTTQRAIEVKDAAGVKKHLIAAIRAAAQRSRELGG
ncbi:MAG: pyrroline-5-carboxylate reductase [Planctomycetes bacterium]|nr:pyrroline-5-carboxylate reductase [Planctomycetota bacterium]